MYAEYRALSTCSRPTDVAPQWWLRPRTRRRTIGRTAVVPRRRPLDPVIQSNWNRVWWCIKHQGLDRKPARRVDASGAGDSLVLHDSAVKGTVEPMGKRRSGAFFAGCCAPVEAFRITSVSGHATPQFPNLIAGSLTRRLKPISRDLLRTASILTFHIVKSFDT